MLDDVFFENITAWEPNIRLLKYYFDDQAVISCISDIV